MLGIFLPKEILLEYKTACLTKTGLALCFSCCEIHPDRTSSQVCCDNQTTPTRVPSSQSQPIGGLRYQKKGRGPEWEGLGSWGWGLYFLALFLGFLLAVAYVTFTRRARRRSTKALLVDLDTRMEQELAPPAISTLSPPSYRMFALTNDTSPLQSGRLHAVQ